MALNEASYTQDCLDAEHLVRSTIMRIVQEMTDEGELAQRREFRKQPAKTPNWGMHVPMSRSLPVGNIFGGTDGGSLERRRINGDRWECGIKIWWLRTTMIWTANISEPGCRLVLALSRFASQLEANGVLIG